MTHKLCRTCPVSSTCQGFLFDDEELIEECLSQFGTDESDLDEFFSDRDEEDDS